MKYEIMTLDGNRMLYSFRIVNGQYHFNISESGENRDIIQSIHYSNENALIFQLVQLLKENNPKLAINSKMIYQHFFLLNLKDAMQFNYDLFQEESDDEIANDSKNTANLKFFFENNSIFIRFSEKEPEIEFVSFYKSGSMSRDCIISFIDKSIKDELEKRLLLEIPYSNPTIGPQIIESKHYAYRGLYLSDGNRVSITDYLNEDTVIILDDETIRTDEIPLITAKNTQLNTKTTNPSFTEKRNNIYYKIVEEKQALTLTPFDGEGFIDNEYARLINNSLKKGNASSSFQIRLPFVKGMVHRVDFHRFLNEWYSSLPQSCSEQLGKDSIYVKDCFGIPRDIKKAHIILTKSMFKLFNDFKTLFKPDNSFSPNISDPMKYYFDMLKKYNHSLYVIKTNANLNQKFTTKLTYQYINTLKISDFTIQTLYNSLEKTTFNYTKTSYFNNAKNDTMWGNILEKNKNFIRDPYIKMLFENERRSNVIDYFDGRIPVAGRDCFLSNDLLALLLFIVRNVLTSDGTMPYKNYIHDIPFASKDNNDYPWYSNWLLKINKSLLYSDSCYMPHFKKRDSQLYNGYCGLLRSPHLSRNEECMLSINTPSIMDTYNDYFGNLNNIIMVAKNSLAPNILGGADNDGDTINVIFDTNIVRNIKDGSYEQDSRTGTYHRKRPVIVIPSEKGSMITDKGYLSFESINNTFNNRIGFISDAAIRIAQSQYLQNDSEVSYDLETSCEACTIITGLEIDAAKSGIHPHNNINSIVNYALSITKSSKKLSDSKKSVTFSEYDYIKNRKKLKKGLLNRHSLNILDNGKEYQVRLKKNNQNAVLFNVYKQSNLFPFKSNLNHLKIGFCRLWNTVNKEIDVDDFISSTYSSKNKKEFLFDFESYDNWHLELNSDQLNNLSILYENWKALLATKNYLTPKLNKIRYNEESYYHLFKELLVKQYFSLDFPLPNQQDDNGAPISISEAIKITYSYMHAVLNTPVKKKDALDRLIKCDWHLTSVEERETKFNYIIDGENNTSYKPIAFQLLSNFKKKGFNLLYYLIKDIIVSSYEEWIVYDYLHLKEKTSLNDYELSFLNGVSQHLQTPWKATTDKLKQDVYDMFDGNYTEILMYSYCLWNQIEEKRKKKSKMKNESFSTFFWTINDEQTIYKHVYDYRGGSIC